MKKIFSIILPLLFLSGGIVLAFNVQNDDPCLEPQHPGYSYEGIGTPPLPYDPENLPEGVALIGKYIDDFGCDETANFCHWAYDETQEAWVPCNTGNLELNP